MNRVRALLSILIVTIPGASASEGLGAPDWSDVSAIFEERCINCHSAVAGASKGLRLDDYGAALAGGEDGLVLIAGNAEGSELLLRIRGISVPRMPFLSRALPEEEIALIESWIMAGLPLSSE